MKKIQPFQYLYEHIKRVDVRLWETLNRLRIAIEGTSSAVTDVEEELAAWGQLTNLAATVAEYGYDESTEPGKPVARVSVTYKNPSDADENTYFDFWIYTTATSVTQPPDAGKFEYRASMRWETNRTDVDMWLDRPKQGDPTDRLWIRAVTCNEYYSGPPTNESPVCYVDITAAGIPAQVTDFAVTLENCGTPAPAFWFNVTYRRPIDLDFWYAGIWRVACDSNYNPLPGQELLFVYGVGSDATPGVLTTERQSADGPISYPLNTEYWKWVAKSFSRAGIRNDTSPPSSNLMVPTSPLINAGKLDPVSLHGSLAIALEKLSVAAKGVTTDKLADLAVTAAQLAGGSVTEDKVLAGAITELKIAAGAVTNWRLANLAVDAAKLATGAVTNTKIFDGAVGSNKLASLAVLEAHIGTAAVTTAKIGNAAVGSAAIANLAVGTAHIQAAAITDVKIANAAVGSAAIAALAVGTAHIQTAAITDAKIGALAVGEAHIQNLAVTNAKIGSCSIGKLTAGTATFTGDAYFQNTGSIWLYNGGNLYISPGTIYGSHAHFKIAGSGWEIIAGMAPEIRNVGTYGKMIAGTMVAQQYLWLPYVADPNVAWAPAGKVACYDAGGVFRGWIPVMQ